MLICLCNLLEGQCLVEPPLATITDVSNSFGFLVPYIFVYIWACMFSDKNHSDLAARLVGVEGETLETSICFRQHLHNMMQPPP